MKRLVSTTVRSLHLYASVMLISITLAIPLYAKSAESLRVSVQQLGALQQQIHTASEISNTQEAHY